MKQEQKVDNDIYRRLGNAWWDDDVGEFSTLRFWFNPVRFGYFVRVLDRQKALERGRRPRFLEAVDDFESLQLLEPSKKCPVSRP